MATIRLIPSTYYLSNTSYLSVSNAANMYDNTDSTTYGTFTHNRASNSNTYYAYLRGFNFDDVPSNATISAWTVKLKASATGHTTSTSSSYYMSLCNGTTQIGSTSASGRLTTSVTTFTFAEGSLTWDTIVGYGSNFGIRIPLRRASSNTADVVSVYGAEIEVEYTIPDPRTVTSTLTGDGTINPSGVTNTFKDSEYTLTITPTNKSDTVTVTNNGVDVTSQLIAHGSESSVAVAPADVTTTSIQSGASYAEYAVGHTAESPSSSGTSSNMYAASGSTGYASYTFDLSGVPSGATIESIEATCYGHRENAAIDTTHVSQCAIYNGTTSISSVVDFPSTSNSTIQLEATTLPSSLSNINIRHTVGYYGGLVLGITLTVTYSTGSGLDHYTYTYIVSDNATIAVVIGGSSSKPKIYKKVNSSWTEVSYSKIYLKVNGSWVEKSDPTDAFDTSTNYVWS